MKKGRLVNAVNTARMEENEITTNRDPCGGRNQFKTARVYIKKMNNDRNIYTCRIFRFNENVSRPSESERVVEIFYPIFI